MPTHHGTRTKVSLLIADLDSTTTKEPETARGHSESGRAALERCENDLANGRELKESFIPLGNDDLNTLHFLGQDGAYMPFMMVRAGKELRQNTALHRVYHPDPVRNAIYAQVLGHSPEEAITTPHALAIRLDITEQTFLKTNRPANDMKIDILLNGKFANATTVPARSIKDRRISFVFGGLRTHYMVERPWVVLPRDKNADGSQRYGQRTETPQDRWNELSQAVSEEVGLRTTYMGGRTPVVEYFDALSKLPMPPEFDQWDERDTHRYSIIDVVLSHGHGRKDAANSAYLTKPTRLRPRADASLGVPPVPPRMETIEEYKSISDIDVRRDGNVITTSEQLPKYLKAALEKAGLRVQTTAEQASRWATASGMLKDVLDRPKEPETPRGLPPPMSPPRSSIFTGSRLREVGVLPDFEVPDIKLPPSSLDHDSFTMSGSPASPPRDTRSASNYTTVSSGSPHKRRRTSFGISNRGIRTAAGSRSDMSALEAPTKQSVTPEPFGISNRTTAGSRTDLSALEAPTKQSVTPEPFSISNRTTAGSNNDLSALEAPTKQSVNPEFGISNRGVFTTAGSSNDLSALEAPTKQSVNPEVGISNRTTAGSRSDLSALEAPTKQSVNPEPIGISNRGIFTTAGSSNDLSTLEAPTKDANPDALSPVKKQDQSTRVVFTLGNMHVRTTVVPTRLLTSMPPPLTTPSRNPRPSRRIARARSNRSTANTSYTLFPNTYTPSARASPVATSPVSAAGTTTTPPHSSSRSRNRRPTRGGDSPIKLSSERQAEYEAAFRAFVAPAPCRDAAVSYSAVRTAWQGTQWTQGMERGAGGGVVRQIRTERGGEFREEGIVLGVRFVVF